ncbi:hypothetical protein B0T20DRAFT_470427 [Sordaria brevicollis]|uniref:C2H2-type domain-containing protein n=1 Tax=Sordaria brevicollis TaxID=83679 RepID=A0AAE0PBC2_SORBR|nr:hypothetical protein B0T20DRAFT_470427 [Sordaria brevicollis]
MGAPTDMMQQHATESAVPVTTRPGIHQCTFRRKGKDFCKDFPSKGDLEHHMKTAHKFRCAKGCPNVGFPSRQKMKEHHESLKHWPKNSPFSRPAGIKLYRCGCCGIVRSHRQDHRRHVKTCKGGNLDQPVRYECARHGPTSFDREEHISHLEECIRRRPGKPKSQDRARSGADTHEGSVPIDAPAPAPPSPYPVKIFEWTPATEASDTPFESTPDLCFSATVSPDDTALPPMRAPRGQPDTFDLFDAAPALTQCHDPTYDYTKGLFDSPFFVRAIEPLLDDGTESNLPSPLPLLW